MGQTNKQKEKKDCISKNKRLLLRLSYIYYLYKFCNVYLHFFSILIGITILARNEQRELLPPFLFCAYIVEIIVFATGLRRSHFAPVLPPFSFPPSCFASCLVSRPPSKETGVFVYLLQVPHKTLS